MLFLTSVEVFAQVPPSEAVPKSGRRLVKPEKPTLTWIGFQPGEAGGARVFAQLSAPITFAVETDRGEVVITVPGVEVASRNELRPIDASHFKTPVVRISVAKRRGKAGGITIRITQRYPGVPDVHLEAGPDGSHYLMMTFKPGGWQP